MGQRLAQWHSTNTLLPMTMHVGELLSHDARDEEVVQPGLRDDRPGLAEAGPLALDASMTRRCFDGQDGKARTETRT